MKNDTSAGSSTDTSPGQYGQLIEPRTMRFERHLPGPIERVWEYLTNPEKRALWFAGGPMELRVGGVAELHFNHERITSEPTPQEFKEKWGDEPLISVGHVTECEPPHRLSYTWWEDDGDQSEICFVLTEVDGGVLLTLTHRRLRDEEQILSISTGWHTHLDLLEDLLNDVEPRPFWTNLFARKEEYPQRLPL